MRKLLILAAVAAVSAACHNRSEDEVGAAPQGRTDTTAVTDSTAVTHVLDSTVTADSVGLDSTAAPPTADSTAVGQDSSLTSTPQDTLGPLNPGAGAIDTAGVQRDTSIGPSSTTVPTDSTAASDTAKTKQ